MRLVLHIGGEKTGTTALQDFLFRNSWALLENEGILYPATGPLCFNSAHFPVLTAFLPAGSLEFVPADKNLTPDRLRQELLAISEAVKPRILILSAEHFTSRMKQPAVSAFSAMLRDMKCFDGISAVFFVRAQDELAISSFSTALKFGRREWFATQHISPKNPYFNHFAAAEMWASELGEGAVLVRPYARGATNVPAEFMSVLGISDMSAYDMPRQMNESLSLEQARILHAVNQLLPNPHADRGKDKPASNQQAQRLRNIIVQAIAQPGALPVRTSLFKCLSPQQLAAIRLAFEPANTSLLQKYGVNLGFSDPAPGESGPEAAGETDTELLARALIACARAAVRASERLDEKNKLVQELQSRLGENDRGAGIKATE